MGRLNLPNQEVEVEGPLPWTPAVRRVIANAQAEADRAQRKLVDEGHLLLALLQEQEGEAIQVLMGLGVNLEELRTKAQWLLHSAEAIRAENTLDDRIQAEPGSGIQI